MTAKAEELKRLLSSQSEPLTVSLAMFFDGNDDEGSIGCNLLPHPGLDVFRKVLTDISSLPGVVRAEVMVTEVDPGDGCWPHSDTVLIYGDVDLDAVRAHAEPIQPDEIRRVGLFSPKYLKMLAKQSGLPLTTLWWD